MDVDTHIELIEKLRSSVSGTCTHDTLASFTVTVCVWKYFRHMFKSLGYCQLVSTHSYLQL